MSFKCLVTNGFFDRYDVIDNGFTPVCPHCRAVAGSPGHMTNWSELWPRVETMLARVRKGSKHAVDMYTNGDSYNLARTLYRLVGGDVVINANETHAALRLGGRFYDITGEISDDGFTIPDERQCAMMRNWDFAEAKEYDII